MVSPRGLEVLRVIVQDYVATREPVGSKSVVDRHSFGVSAATIRNDMALLEDEELIAAPHTSSGRIPTDKGYRVFVDQLTEMQPISVAQRQAIRRFLDEAVDLDDTLIRTVRLLSQLTGQLAIVQYPSLARSSVRRIEIIALTEQTVMQVLITDSGRVEQRIIDAGQRISAETAAALGLAFNQALAGKTLGDCQEELERLRTNAPREISIVMNKIADQLSEQLQPERNERLALAGTSNLVRTGEDFHGTITPVLEAIEEQVTLLRLVGDLQADSLGLATSIGRENVGGLTEASIIASSYGRNNRELARVGVLGPTRMDYPTNMAAVRVVARYLTRLLSEDQ
ncbi:heat-inducible transcriptional repressor HrcA [Humidisolicoccus flavus]|uniref:heat-inducible transcriptional repressor HrcA n=1 Tax=Humidisolicoccus flavus TaxID=3111414 RepID=UPI00324F9FCB